MHIEFTQTLVFWYRFYVAISIKSRGFRTKVRIANPHIARESGRKRHSTARLQTDARPPRGGSEQFGSGTQAYGQN